MNISARASTNGRSGYRQTVIMSCAVFSKCIWYTCFLLSYHYTLTQNLFCVSRLHFANVRTCEGDWIFSLITFFFFCMVISEQLTIVVIQWINHYDLSPWYMRQNRRVRPTLLWMCKRLTEKERDQLRQSHSLYLQAWPCVDPFLLQAVLWLAIQTAVWELSRSPLFHDTCLSWARTVWRASLTHIIPLTRTHASAVHAPVPMATSLY